MEKKTNKAKLDIFQFLRKSAESQGLKHLIKLTKIVPSMGNSINTHLLGYFCIQNSYLQ